MRKIVSTCAIFLILDTVVFAWDNKITHPAISEEAANTSKLGIFLRNNLGINGGLETTLSWTVGNKEEKRRIVEWIKEGGKREDDDPRYLNHFHRPIEMPPKVPNWDVAGLDDSVFLIPFSGESALLWAQNLGIDDQSNLEWSWQATRGHFYQGLIAGTESEREAELAQMFRGLGHQIHLVQDMSQPSHVRNDAHVEDALGYFWGVRFIDRLENWAKHFKDRALGFISQPSVFPSNINGLSDFWDTDQYDGTANTLGLTTGMTVGLAEYTNANFFSDDTINSSALRHQFPFPSINIQDYYKCADFAPPLSAAQMRWYLSRTPCQQTPMDHFLATSFLTEPQPTEIGPSMQMDDRVYEDYARQLLPRAVGYSAALIDFFFRGELKVTSQSGGLTIQNLSTDAMESGTISVYYDSTSNTRKELVSARYDFITPIPPNGAVTLNFTPPTDNIVQNRYIVVFQGKLGKEEGAVIGSVPSLKIYYVSTRGGVDKIYRMNTDGSNPTLVYDNLDPNIILMNFAPSPDGRQLAFVSWNPSSPDRNPPIKVLDLENGMATQLLDGSGIGVVGAFPSWSPNRTEIAFSRDIGLTSLAQYQIFKIDVATGSETRLTNFPDTMNSGFNSQPTWSPDGLTIALSVNATTDNTSPDICGSGKIIYLIDPTGIWIDHVTCTSVATPQNDDKAPSWSNDGNEIVFMRRAYGEPYSEIYRVDLGTKNVTKLTNSDGAINSESIPVWSPVEPVIAVGSDRDGDFDIWLVDPNGGGYLTNLTDSSNLEFDGWPAYGWAP